MNETEFTRSCEVDGFKGKRMDRSAGMSNEMHTHIFSAKLMVLKGEFTVVFKDVEAVCGPGDTCEVPAGTEHAERPGSDGATILIGKK